MDGLAILGGALIGVAVGGVITLKCIKVDKLDTKENNHLRNRTEIKNSIIKYYFTKTTQKPDQKLIEVIDNSKSKLDIAIYTLTEKEIVKRIIYASKRGVKVRIISDNKQSQKEWQRRVLADIIETDIPVKVNTHDGYMHLKITIADETTVTTGSFNFTKAAKTRHDEVLVVIDDEKLAKEWSTHFDTMWNDTNNYRVYAPYCYTKKSA